MQISNSTVFIAGATSGIGLALAQRLASAGGQVIIGGRRADALKGIEAENTGIDTVEIDVTDAASVTLARDVVLNRHPDLSTVVTMSGVMHPEDLRDPAHFAVAEQTVATNLLGTIRVLDAFTPHLVTRGSGTLVTVSSGIAFVPFPLTPTYGATKAAIHSYSESLRKQLAGTGVEVAELVPPLTATTLMGSHDNPAAMPVGDFVDEALQLLTTDPTPHEIVVERAKTQRNAVEDGTYNQLLDMMSQALAALGR